MDAPTPEMCNIPRDFERFVGAPAHRVFAVLDGPDAAAAMADLRAGGGLDDEDDIWMFCGDEGVRRLDIEGSGHGLHGTALRTMQRIMSDDVDYLRLLEKAARAGHAVLAVRVDDASLDRVAGILQAHGARSLARVAHLNFLPVGVDGWL